MNAIKTIYMIPCVINLRSIANKPRFSPWKSFQRWNDINSTKKKLYKRQIYNGWSKKVFYFHFITLNSIVCYNIFNYILKCVARIDRVKQRQETVVCLIYIRNRRQHWMLNTSITASYSSTQKPNKQCSSIILISRSERFRISRR